MNNLYILAKINNSAVAINSNHVESVVRVQDVVPVPKSSDVVAGLFALRSRVLTLIDSQVLTTGQKRENLKNALAVVTEIGGHSFGLIVDSVEDVVSINREDMEISISTGKQWELFVSDVCLVNGNMVMILDTEKMVNGLDKIAA